MSSDDTSDQLNDDRVPMTAPTITTILERINALGNELRTGIADFRQSVESKLDDTNKRLHRLENKIDLLMKDLYEARTDNKILESRVDKLEEKAR